MQILGIFLKTLLLRISQKVYKKYHAQKKVLKLALVVELAQLNYCTKIAKARPHRVECPTDSSVQKQWSMIRYIRVQFDWAQNDYE